MGLSGYCGIINGLYLRNYILNNTISEYPVGIWTNAYNQMIEGNNVSHNHIGLYISSLERGTKISRNNFIEIRIHASFICPFWQLTPYNLMYLFIEGAIYNVFFWKLLGQTTIPSKTHIWEIWTDPRVMFDLHPASVPYHIPWSQMTKQSTHSYYSRKDS